MKFRSLIISIILVGPLLCFGCRQELSPAERIKVGVISSLTGPEARFGQAQKYGYEMALDEINQTGVLGKKIELVYQDDTSKPEVASLTVEKLSDRSDIVALMGAYSSSATFPAAAVANRYGIPMLCPSATTDEVTRQGYEWVFRVCASASDYGRTLVEFLTKVADARRLAVVYENTQFGSSVARAALEQAPRASIEIVAYEAYDQGGTDFTPLLTRVKSETPDAVLFVSYLADATLLMRQSKEIDLNPKVFTAGGAGFSLPDFLKGAGDTAEYTISVTQWTPDAKWTGSREWAEHFRARWNYEPSYHSVQAYMSLKILADAIERAGSTERTAVRDAIRTSDLDSVFGPIHFTDVGQNEHPVAITQVLNGKFVTVWPPAAAIRPPVLPTPQWRARALVSDSVAAGEAHVDPRELAVLLQIRPHRLVGPQQLEVRALRRDEGQRGRAHPAAGRPRGRGRPPSTERRPGLPAGRPRRARGEGRRHRGAGRRRARDALRARVGRRLRVVPRLDGGQGPHRHEQHDDGRCERELGKRFGDSAYAAEELIAELGAAFLCAQLEAFPEVQKQRKAILENKVLVIEQLLAGLQLYPMDGPGAWDPHDRLALAGCN